MTHGDFARRYGPVALIAGGSEGVGASYARLLAERGLDLVLVARSGDKLGALRAELKTKWPQRRVDVISVDLTATGAPALLVDRTASRDIGLFIHNAGANSRHGPFVDLPLEYAQRLTTLNVLTPMALCHHFGGLMRDRGRGGILLASSLAYLAGSPGIAVYSAAKAFLTTFGEALWFELAPHGVDVLVHAFGSVDTPFVERTFPKAYGRGEAPDAVALAGLDALARGPVLRAGRGDDFHMILSGKSRADAVRSMALAGRTYED